MNKRNDQNASYSRSEGYGMNLYRNVDAGKIAGVCAGLGDHFEIDHFVMRVIFVAGLMFMGPLAFWGYIIAWIAIVPKPSEANDISMEYDEQERCYRKKKIFRYQDSASVRLRRARERLDDIVNRVGNMERYVTSSKYDLNKQFADLDR
ncbi:MAG: PspC domain-containing protein [Agarilytica sp.]